MSERVTLRELESLVRRVNLATHSRDEWPDDPYNTDWPIYARDERNHPRQIGGVYHLSGAYGGYALYLTSDPDENGESRGVTDVLGTGHVPKRDLRRLMSAFLEGINTATP